MNDEATEPAVPQEGEAGPHAGAGHGEPDKSAKKTEDAPARSRAEVSNYEIVEHFRWDEDEVNERLGAILRKAFHEVAERAKEIDTPMRPAAYELGIQRVVEAASTRGYI